MLERIWTSLLELSAQLVTPDWGAIIAFLPIRFVVIVLAILVIVTRRLVKAPPARRGKQRLDRRTPAGIHMPGPSFSPAFAAMGTFLVLLGFVFGGITLILGAIALVLTLLYWLAEGLRIYDKDIGPSAETLPAVIHEGPPPGVHMPGPSWRPFLGALGVFLLLLGLVFEGWLLAVGVVALIATLVGWLPDAIHEYRRTVEADRTGHLDSGPPPATPTRMLAVLTVLVVGAAVLQTSVFAAGEANGGTPGASPSAAPAGSGGPAGSSGPPPSGGPAGSGGPPPSGAAADVNVQAKDLKFLEASWTGPAGRPFTIAFTNEDKGTPHNVELKDGGGTSVFRGDVFNGVATKVYEVPAQPAGQYTCVCTVHTSMTGTATLQ
jgi:plastocyanin